MSTNDDRESSQQDAGNRKRPSQTNWSEQHRTGSREEWLSSYVIPNKMNLFFPNPAPSASIDEDQSDYYHNVLGTFLSRSAIQRRQDWDKIGIHVAGLLGKRYDQRTVYIFNVDQERLVWDDWEKNNSFNHGDKVVTQRWRRRCAEIGRSTDPRYWDKSTWINHREGESRMKKMVDAINEFGIDYRHNFWVTDVNVFGTISMRVNDTIVHYSAEIPLQRGLELEELFLEMQQRIRNKTYEIKDPQAGLNEMDFKPFDRERYN